jgi:hypothetical protein
MGSAGHWRHHLFSGVQMFESSLVFLRNQLNEHLGRQFGQQAGDGGEAMVAFPDGEKLDPISFKLGAVTLLLINVEQETSLRAPDPYAKIASDGSSYRGQPDIRLNLGILFVARYKQYEQSLGMLSQIIQYFQTCRVFDHQNSPSLDSRIDKLILELITLPFEEQNNIWSALRTTYQPSVLYRVRMIVFESQPAQAIPPVSGATIDADHAVRADP